MFWERLIPLIYIFPTLLEASGGTRHTEQGRDSEGTDSVTTQAHASAAQTADTNALHYPTLIDEPKIVEGWILNALP